MKNFFYIFLTFITILSFTAYRIIGIEYVDKIKVYFPKKNKRGFMTRFRKRKWRASKIFMLLSIMTIYLILLIDSNWPEMGLIFLFAFFTFIISAIYMEFSPSRNKEDQLIRLILTNTKIIIYKRLGKIIKREYGLRASFKFLLK